MGYWVHFIDDDPPLVSGPYPLKNAKQYALIGSRTSPTGGRRVVTRGKDGPAIRLYELGYRRWPRGDEIEEAGLRHNEIPKEHTPYLPKGLRAQWVANPSGEWVLVPSWVAEEINRYLHALAASVGEE